MALHRGLLKLLALLHVLGRAGVYIRSRVGETVILLHPGPPSPFIKCFNLGVKRAVHQNDNLADG